MNAVRLFSCSQTEVCALVAAGLLALSGMCSGASGQVASPALWSVNPASNVLGTVSSGNTIYIGGSFRTVGHSSGGGVPFSPGTGAPIAPYPPVAGVVTIAIPDGRGGWFIGGRFSAVGALPRSHLAHILADGGVDAWSPDPDGEVSALSLSDGILYLGGFFTTIAGKVRHHIGAIDTRTGRVTDWDPDANSNVGPVLAVGNRVYVSGNFSQIGGRPLTSLAALDAKTGRAFDWNPAPNSYVAALAWGDSVLYVGGAFSAIGGQSRNLIAALDPSTGAATAWNPRALPDYSVDNGAYVAALLKRNGTLFVAGSFDQIGGEPRAALAQLDLATGDATSWDARATSNYPGFPVHFWALSLVGTNLYLAGEFSGLGGRDNNGNGGLGFSYAGAVDTNSGLASDWNPRPDSRVLTLAASASAVFAGGLFGSVWDWQSRSGLAALDARTGALLPWNPIVDGGITTMAIRGNAVYVAGIFHNVGGQFRAGIAALDAATGLATTWNPSCDGLINTIVAGDSVIYVGGNFQTVGGSHRQFVAALDTLTGAATDWNPTADDRVFSIARKNEHIYLGGAFTRVGGADRAYLATVDVQTGLATSWNPQSNSEVNAIAIAETTIFVGGDFDHVGDQPRGRLAAFDLATGALTPWRADADNDVRCLALCGNVLYAGGMFVQVGTEPRPHLVAINAVSGDIFDWNPAPNGIVWSIAAGSALVYASGGFRTMALSPASGIAAVLSVPASAAVGGVERGRLALAQCAPNPAVSMTAIRFTTPSHGPFNVSVYDLQGRRVRVLTQGEATTTAGEHEVVLSTAGWLPGCYIYRLEAEGGTATRKMLVIR